MADKFELDKYVINAVIILFLAGIFSALLGSIMATIDATLSAYVVGLWTLITVILAGYLLYEAKLTNFVEIILLIGIATGIGTILIGFVPALSPFMLSAGAFTWSGLASTLFYVALADLIGDKIGL